MIPVPTGLSCNLVRSSQRALALNSPCLWVQLSLVTRAAGWCPCANEHLTVIHSWLVWIRNDFKLCMLSLDFRRIPEVRLWALCYKDLHVPCDLLPSFLQQHPSDTGRGRFQNPGKWKLYPACLLPLWDNLRLPWAAGGDNTRSGQMMLLLCQWKGLCGGIQLITEMSWAVNFTIG